MITKILTTALAGLALGLALFIAGCSDNDQGNISDPLADEIVSQLMDDSDLATDSPNPDAVLANETAPPADLNPAADAPAAEVVPLVKDMLLKNNVIYSLVDNGIIAHDLSNGSNSLIPSDEKLGAIIDMGDRILVGGDNLYTLKGDILSAEDFDLNLNGSITALERHGSKLMVGTTAGFYQIDIDGIRELATDINVAHIESNDMGVWVGTAGEGLYYYNGDTFHKRYLQRDSSLFDNVTALRYHYNHLYLGTDNGLFVYDGGRWHQFGLADGLPSETITAINADDWVIKVGTASGAVSFFNNEFKPIAKMESLAVTNFLEDGKKLIAATPEGIVMKSGGLVSTLFDGEMPAPTMAFEDTF